MPRCDSCGGSVQWIKGYSPPDHPEDEGDMTIEAVVQKLRDEVTGLLMQRFGGHQRALAMILTKLDEARLWALQYAEDTNAGIFVERGPVLDLVRRNYGTHGIPADTTETTD